MGSTYTNAVLFEVDLDTVVGACSGPAFACAAPDGVVLFSERDEVTFVGETPELSAALGCRALIASVHDSDVLSLSVVDRGTAVTGGSAPDPFAVFGVDRREFDDIDPGLLEAVGLSLDADADAGAAGDQIDPPIDPEALVTALGRGDAASVAAALAASSPFAEELHAALVDVLALPQMTVGWGYRYLSAANNGYDGPPLTVIEAR